MAKKKLKRIAKLEFVAGQAKPGPELAGLGIDMAGFTREFNDATRDKQGDIIPAIIKAFDDRSYEFTILTSPAAFLLKKAAGIQKGSAKPNAINVGEVTKDQVREIAAYKMQDLNAGSLDAAISMIIGTAKSLGMVVKGDASTIATDEVKEELPGDDS